jgi:ubiquinone/menaquinone biosynthesis C-methylase UbiE
MSDQQLELWFSDKHLDYHLRQFREPYRSTVHLIKFVCQTLGDLQGPRRGIDVGCGAGANIYWFSKSFGETKWVGLDIVENLLHLGRSVFTKLGMGNQVDFITGDFYNLENYFEGHCFDLVLSIQTLSWLPEYEGILPKLFTLAKPGGFVFVTSLFTDFHVEAKIKIVEYPQNDDWKGVGPCYYNIYCYDRFKDFCLQHGAEQVIAEDFWIDVDLVPPENRLMGTYTQTLENGLRLQCSGPLMMPWKFIAIKMLGP